MAASDGSRVDAVKELIRGTQMNEARCSFQHDLSEESAIGVQCVILNAFTAQMNRFQQVVQLTHEKQPTRAGLRLVVAPKTNVKNGPQLIMLKTSAL